MKAPKFLSSGAILIAVAALAGCQNYTVAPVCNDTNAVSPPGLTGVYTFSVQKDDFSVETSEIKIGVDSKGRMKMRGLRDDGDDNESHLCAIGGYYVQESFDKKVNGYNQSRLYITGMGMTQAPVFFDKTGLDAAGIANSTFEVPQSLAKIAGPKVVRAAQRLVSEAVSLIGDEKPSLGLMVDNSGVSPEAVMSQSYAAPVSLTLYRK